MTKIKVSLLGKVKGKNFIVEEAELDYSSLSTKEYNYEGITNEFIEDGELFFIENAKELGLFKAHGNRTISGHGESTRSITINPVDDMSVPLNQVKESYYLVRVSGNNF